MAKLNIACCGGFSIVVMLFVEPKSKISAVGFREAASIAYSNDATVRGEVCFRNISAIMAFSLNIKALRR